MISKAKIKYIRSLELKKNRTAEGLFVAEGPKVVGDLMPTMRLRYVVATESWLKATKQRFLPRLKCSTLRKKNCAR